MAINSPVLAIPCSARRSERSGDGRSPTPGSAPTRSAARISSNVMLIDIYRDRQSGIEIAIKIRLAARMPENKIRKILKGLIASGFVEEFEGLQGNRVYPLTDAGNNHPQRDLSSRRAAEPRLPVESDRVRKVLSTIFDSGALRIRDVTDTLRIPRQSTNALMQYLKRKHLVEKISSEFEASYSLTDEGRAALAEMTRRFAA